MAKARRLRVARWLWLLMTVPQVLFAADVADSVGAAPPVAASASISAPISDNGPATGLADSAALRATVFGTPPQNIAPMPARVPLREIDISMPGARPVPKVLWFDSRLRVWFSAQDKPAPLAIVISGTGSAVCFMARVIMF
jgi:hypothetical protein